MYNYTKIFNEEKMMDLLRIGICDDEQSWHKQAKTIIEKYMSDIDIGIELCFFNCKNELLTYDGLPLDSVFMDIELENENGIEIAELLNEKWPGCAIVYVTNYLFYATDSYDTEHLYFVLKEHFEQKLPAIFDKILHAREQVKNKLVFQVIGENNHKVVLLPRDILFFERNRRRTQIHTVWGIYETWDKISDIEKCLSELDFVRCHNSYIVYLPAVREFSATSIIMKNGETIAVSRNFAARTKASFTRWAASKMI